MTLPLQPMSTSPRDGSEVLLVFRGRGIKCIAEWCATAERWSLCGISVTDAAFTGWLDIEALARDSARWDRVESEGLTVQRREGPPSLDGWAVLKHAKLLTTAQTARAAIDKERERG